MGQLKSILQSRGIQGHEILLAAFLFSEFIRYARKQIRKLGKQRKLRAHKIGIGIEEGGGCHQENQQQQEEEGEEEGEGESQIENGSFMSKEELAQTAKKLGISSSQEEAISHRGMKFVMTQDEDEEQGGIDLSIFGAVPYMLPSFARLIELYDLNVGKSTQIRQDERFLRLLFGAFAIFPMLDLLLGEDYSNPTKEQQKKSRHLSHFRFPLYLWTAVELVTTVSTYMKALGPNSKMRTSEIIGLLGKATFFNGALGITVAHELCHAPSKFDNLLAHMLLANVNYMHWNKEHTDGHHKHVATPDDPATARFGENVYTFVPRCMMGTLRNAIAMERERLEELGYRGNEVWMTPKNRMYWYAGIPFAWSLFLAKITRNWKAIPAFYLSALLSASLLEVINMVEHLGLRRNKLENGSYEPVNPLHSWNAAHKLTNTLLFKLERHSDHHSFASRPYHLLRNFKESPNLPTGYAGMVAMSFVPPAQNWIMGPLIEAHNKRCDLMFAKETDETVLQKAYDEYKAQEKIATRKTTLFGVLFAFGLYKTLPPVCSLLRKLDSF